MTIDYEQVTDIIAYEAGLNAETDTNPFGNPENDDYQGLLAALWELGHKLKGKTCSHCKGIFYLDQLYDISHYKGGVFVHGDCTEEFEKEHGLHVH